MHKHRLFIYRYNLDPWSDNHYCIFTTLGDEDPIIEFDQDNAEVFVNVSHEVNFCHDLVQFLGCSILELEPYQWAEIKVNWVENV